MCIVKLYLQKTILTRYDEDPAVPYYRGSDFKGLNVEEKTFINSKGVEIHYFYYYYDNPRVDKIILLCHGLGPGHASYLAEIEYLARAGYKVLTLDYTGCGFSKGKRLYSLNAPTLDTMELLDLLKIDKEIVIYGHSLGGYTALNILNLRTEFTKGVIVSGFISIRNEIMGLTKNKFLTSLASNYEKRVIKEYKNLDNIEFLKHTDKKILYLQSKDDQLVPFDYALGEVEKYNNPNITCIDMEGKKHNPNYSADAIKYMNEVFSEYHKLIKEKKLNTEELRKEFMADKSIAKMTEQDKDIMDKVLSFIE